MKPVSPRVVGRLSLYRRLLLNVRQHGMALIHSQGLADLAGYTAVQVRRDLMVLGYNGTPTRGYDVAQLLEHLDSYLNPGEVQRVVLAGVGNLGRAILSHLSALRPKLKIVASFDVDASLYGRVIAGCHCYGADRLEDIVRQEGATIGIIAVPAAAALETAGAMVRGGIRGIMNFAPAPLRVPPTVYVEDVDIAMSLDRAAFFAGRVPEGVEAEGRMEGVHEES